MGEVGAYEAKTHFSQLLERVAKGERIVITKHGVPIAVLMPVGARANPKEVIQKLKEFRKGKMLKPLTIEELIKEGRNGD